jgi:hypothetical protein
MIEPVVIQDAFADQIGAIEDIGNDNVRIYYYCDQLPLDGGAIIAQHVITAKLIRPKNSMIVTLGQIAQCAKRTDAPLPFTPYRVK